MNLESSAKKQNKWKDVVGTKFEKKEKQNLYSNFEELLDKFELKNIGIFFMNSSYMQMHEQADSLGNKSNKTHSEEIKPASPIDPTLLCKVKVSDRVEYDQKITSLKKVKNHGE